MAGTVKCPAEFNACLRCPTALEEFASGLLQWDAVGKQTEGIARPLVLVSDPGQDLDDEMALVMLRTLQINGWLRLEALVTNLHPADERARLALGTLVELGWSEREAFKVVAAGADGGSRDHSAAAFSDCSDGVHESRTAGGDEIAMSAESYMPFLPPSQKGQIKLIEVYERARDETIAMVLISSLTDAALFLQSNEALFVRKTNFVSIMGGECPLDNVFILQSSFPSIHCRYSSTQPRSPGCSRRLGNGIFFGDVSSRYRA